ncbi:MAG: dihydrodipicolinate reductase [Desulfatitalea sp.]|nr:dihydrodipicolinate reductase [Desulfatitalea sp.]NNK01173.1 dihydrodipicolinate reductase [Desulfatitalea sp.]
MEKINVMLNGLPGNVAGVIARHIQADTRLQLLPYALTGPQIEADQCHIGDMAIALIRPDARETRIETIKHEAGPFISVDYTHPSAISDNAEFYGRHQLPFVMGTTGGDRDQLSRNVVAANNTAIIAPNMAKQIVGFQAMMAYAAETFPNLFKGYHLTLRESHQTGKADTSGTAKAMVTYFNQMGVDFTAEQIEKERDPERQANMWGIPAAHLDGHAWHTYSLVSPDETARFQFTHNVNGRDIYGEGTADAVCFLSKQVAKGVTGKVYSMIDVLKSL